MCVELRLRIMILLCYVIQVERGHRHTSSEALSDYCDGSYFKSHPMFAKHSNALQIFFFYDDIEMCNPLGSHTKKHKLGKMINIEVQMYFCINSFPYVPCMLCTICTFLCEWVCKYGESNTRVSSYTISVVPQEEMSSLS